MEAKLAAELDEAGLLVTAQRLIPRVMEYADLGRLSYLSWVCKVRMTSSICSMIRSVLDVMPH